jgi:hypothetical protein
LKLPVSEKKESNSTFGSSLGMNWDLPFERLDALKLLKQLSPPFLWKLSENDLRDYFINGYIIRRFRLHGRFDQFTYTKIMYSSNTMTISSLLDEKIPADISDPLYEGDAVGCKSLHPKT